MNDEERQIQLKKLRYARYALWGGLAFGIVVVVELLYIALK